MNVASKPIMGIGTLFIPKIDKKIQNSKGK